jgi:ubiquinol-cytochrome c reductase cytochrome c1 subunit
MKKLALAFAASLGLALSAGALAEEDFRLDHSPHDPKDMVSLQEGARTFVNYCQGCHGAQYMRLNRLTGIGLTEAQIRDNLMFAADKVGETMKTSMTAKEAKPWFGVAPPDLSVIARSRGADWLYTYLRSFYRDPKTATGWNNVVFPNVGMPHALWTLQGERRLEVAKAEAGEGGGEKLESKWVQLAPGTLSQVEYDATVRDLVNFLVYIGEPAATQRHAIGIVVLFVLGILFIFAWLLKREFWKDVH